MLFNVFKILFNGLFGFWYMIILVVDFVSDFLMVKFFCFFVQFEFFNIIFILYFQMLQVVFFLLFLLENVFIFGGYGDKVVIDCVFDMLDFLDGKLSGGIFGFIFCFIFVCFILLVFGGIFFVWVIQFFIYCLSFVGLFFFGFSFIDWNVCSIFLQIVLLIGLDVKGLVG